MTDPDQGNSQTERGSSTYATGGGGTVFEHVYGATLLASLLLGDPISGLGDEQTVVTVQFQAGSVSPVDDFVITGEDRGTAQSAGRRLAVAVRHYPKIAPSDDSFVKLLGDFLQMVQDDWTSINSGELRLGLVVAAPNAGVQELVQLADSSRKQSGSDNFTRAINTPGAVTKKIRTRLQRFEEAVDKAAIDRGIPLPIGGVSELTRRLLIGLHPILVRLEGGDAQDRTHTVARLQNALSDASEADYLFSRLCDLAAQYAPAGATVDVTILRRDLAGIVHLGPSSSYSKAWEVLKALSDRLETRTREVLAAGSDLSLHLVRDEARQSLIDTMRSAFTAGHPLIVTGEPDVGKSALALAAMRELTTAGENGIAISLADLPATVSGAVIMLGAPLRSVIGGMAVSPMRFILLDGAEAAALGRDLLLTEIARAGREAGVGLVVVTRSDANAVVKESLVQAAPGSPPPMEFQVRGLDKDEIDQVIANFPVLNRFAGEARSKWLLERPGLVDLLLTSEAHVLLPDGALAEADVFAAIWEKLVRRSGRIDGEHGSPDAREAAMLAIALKQLSAKSSEVRYDVNVIQALRSDGLVQSPGPIAAWRSGEQFASDLVRDFALAHLFVSEGFNNLVHAGSPRWALRAARLACQARLIRSDDRADREFRALQSTFADLAAQYGDRWADLPLEALITLGSPGGLLERLWAELTARGSVLLNRLIRIALQRYTDSFAADPALVEPIVQLLTDHSADAARLTHDVQENAGELQIRWLRGLALRGNEDTSNELRCRHRDSLIGRDISYHSDEVLESLALMGADLDEAAAERLRTVSTEQPHLLAPCVETLAPISLAVHHPDLLLELSSAYYIEDQRVDDQFGYDLMDDGVRHHRFHGIGSPLAAWHQGPFAQLLFKAPRQAIAFINRLLDHAALQRVKQLRNLPIPDMYSRRATKDELLGVELELPEVGRRKFIGDSHVWCWYRGSSVGPYPCMSALLALELLADHMHDVWGIGLSAVVNVLLRDCNNLATPGLVVGFLVRHLDKVVDELDPWLAQPAIWSLEFQRFGSEGQIHVQGPDPGDLHGRENRRLTLRDASAYLVAKAIVANDEESITRLQLVAESLLNNAVADESGATPPIDAGSRLDTVRLWASFFVADNYGWVPRQDGGWELRFSPPELSNEFVEQEADRNRGAAFMRLLSYGQDADRRPSDLSNLERDLRVARELHANPPKSGEEFSFDALAAIASTVIVAVAESRIELPRDDIEWAIGIVGNAARPTTQNTADEYSLFDLGGDRSAAAAIPCLLLPRFNEDDPSLLDDDDREAIWQILWALLTRGPGEVRCRTATSLRRVWAAPCTPEAEEGRICRHAIALDMVEEATRGCRLGAFDIKLQQRRIAPLEGNIIEGLQHVQPEDLFLRQLTAPLVAASACAASDCCVSERASELLGGLLRAHARGAAYWIGENYKLDLDPGVQQVIAESLIETAGAGNIDAVLQYLNSVMAEPLAVQQILEEFARIATYDPTSRRQIMQLWPAIMAALLDLLESDSAFKRTSKRRSGDESKSDAIAALLPTPHLRVTDSKSDETLHGARSGWLNIDAIEQQLGRWLPLAEGSAKCADSLARFLLAQPESVQASQGLELVLQIVGERFDRIARHTWYLGEWLERLWATQLLDSVQRGKFQVLVDGLAASGDSRALRIQKSIE